MKPKGNCSNCKHGGKVFRLAGYNHLFCEHPQTVAPIDAGTHDFREALREWYCRCDKWEQAVKRTCGNCKHARFLSMFEYGRCAGPVGVYGDACVPCLRSSVVPIAPDDDASRCPDWKRKAKR